MKRAWLIVRSRLPAASTGHPEKDALAAIGASIQYATAISLGTLAFALSVPSIYPERFHALALWYPTCRDLVIMSWGCLALSLLCGGVVLSYTTGMMVTGKGSAKSKTLAWWGLGQLFFLVPGVVALAAGLITPFFLDESFVTLNAGDAVDRALGALKVPVKSFTSAVPSLIVSANSREPTWQVITTYMVGSGKTTKSVSTTVFIDATSGRALCLPTRPHCSAPSPAP